MITVNQKKWISFTRGLLDEADVVHKKLTDEQLLDMAAGLIAPTVTANMPAVKCDNEAAIILYVKSIMTLSPPDAQKGGLIDLSVLTRKSNKN